ncbi:hypothetical protein CspHIS471_0307740 [Cutaneotrichosporon sp. HIS471]|nr:hypothetical protein CspHIS471_0307740 [Cutaneotrichosporon sp. HIS471]
MLRLKARESSLTPFSFSVAPPPGDDGPATSNKFPHPPGAFLTERDMHMYGAQPLGDEPGRGVVRCTRCARTVLEWAAGEHQRICSHVLDGTPLNAKKGKVDKKVEGKKRRASEVSDTPDSPTKKKARVLEMSLDDDEMDPAAYKGLKKSEIKKLLKERERLKKRAAKEAEKAQAAERRRARANNPLDYDRQCGVINDKGLPCSRSLTCKTHTVGAKRAVQGRTRLYDELFLEWQRAHNPNFKEPAPKREAKVVPKVVKKKRVVPDEEGLRADEDGRREMDELIRAAARAGDRVKLAPAPRPISSPWRTTTYEQISMGDLLTKALAARPRPAPSSITPQRLGSQSKPGPAVVAPMLAPASVTA